MPTIPCCDFVVKSPKLANAKITKRNSARLLQPLTIYNCIRRLTHVISRCLLESQRFMLVPSIFQGYSITIAIGYDRNTNYS